MIDSSVGPGERVVQMAKRAYILSHCFVIWQLAHLFFLECHIYLHGPDKAKSTYRTILITPSVIRLHPDKEDQNRDKSLDSIRPSSQCHISTSNMVIRRDLLNQLYSVFHEIFQLTWQAVIRVIKAPPPSSTFSMVCSATTCQRVSCLQRRGVDLQVGSPNRTCTLNRQIVEKYPKFLYNGLEPNAPAISLPSAPYSDEPPT